MKSFISSVLLIIILIALAVTAFFHWNTNSKIEFKLKSDNDPDVTTQAFSVKNISANYLAPHPSTQTTAETPTQPEATDPSAGDNNTNEEIPLAEPIPTAEPIEEIPLAEPV